MKITNTTIEIRPRSIWESIDLGILLARRHYALLLTCWCFITLPIFALLTACFWYAPLIPFLIWQIPLLPLIICWWLKPIFDRAPLYILSNAVLGHIPTVKQTLLFWLKSLPSTSTLSDLTIHRLNLTRSFNLPLFQLERLTGTTRKKRLKNLLLKRSNATLLTVIFLNFEAVLYSLLITLVFMLVPENSYIEHTNFWTSSFLAHLPYWIVHLACALYIVVLIISEPLYVACGFCLYLNSRTLLDGWDIELNFRRLSQRLSKTLSCILLMSCLVFTASFTTPTKADPQPTKPPIELPNKIISTATTPQPKKPTAIELAREASQQQIKQIVGSAPFVEVTENTHYRWTKAPSANFLTNTIGWFFEDVFKILVWALVIVTLLLVAWQYRHQLPRMGKSKASVPPKQLFGLAITPESLPTDILAEFEKLWQQNKTRQALSLLYRALLSHLVHYYKLPITSSHTEGEIVKLTALSQIPSVTSFTEQLTKEWLQLAYGHLQISAKQKQQLAEGWQQLIKTADKGATK